MTDHAADIPSNAEGKGKTAAEEFDEMFPDENERARASGRPSQRTKTPEADLKQETNPYDIDNLERLLDESQSEEQMLSMSSYGGERYSRSVTEPALSNTSTYDLSEGSAVDMNPMEDMLNIDSMERVSTPGYEKPKDEPEYLDIFDTSNEESPHAMDMHERADRPSENGASSGKRIQLTEDDYADRFFPGRDEEPSSEREVEKAIVEEKAPPVESPLADGPDLALSPLDAIKSRANIGVLLGLLGVVGSAAAIWLGFGTSNRVDHLETQRVAHSPAVTMHAQTAAIASLNHRIDKLSGQFDAHMKQFAQMQENVAVQKASESKPAAAVAMQPKPAVAKPVSVAKTQPKPVTKKPAVVAVKHVAPSSMKPSSPAKPVVAAQPSKNGEWVVNLSSYRRSSVAAKELARITKLGIQADSVKVVVHGRTWFRLRALGFSSEKAAREHLKAVEKRVGIRDAWIGVR